MRSRLCFDGRSLRRSIEVYSHIRSLVRGEWTSDDGRYLQNSLTVVS
jgi:hypothetical protein